MVTRRGKSKFCANDQRRKWIGILGCTPPVFPVHTVRPRRIILAPADVPSEAADNEVVMDDSAIDAEAELTQAEAAEDIDILSGAGSVIALGFWTMLIGAVMLNRSKRRRKAHENIVENTSGMKAAVASW